MKMVFAVVFLSTLLWGNDGVHTFAKSEDCKACHTQIYDEFYGPMHANSTTQKDPIHEAVWANHPNNIKSEQYRCGKCHTPAADNLDKMMTKGQKAMPEGGNRTHQEEISCAYCHRIESIRVETNSNTNVMSKEEKKYFGTLKNLDVDKVMVRYDQKVFGTGRYDLGLIMVKDNIVATDGGKVAYAGYQHKI